MLVKYGYYSNSNDINDLISPLISLLDGKYDKPFPSANAEQAQQFIKVRIYLLFIYIPLKFNLQEKRFEDNRENRAVFNMKIKALKVINLFCNFRIYLRLHVSAANLNCYIII